MMLYLSMIIQIDLLDVAVKKKLSPILMDRANNYRQFNKYRRIINLKEGIL